MDILAVGWFPRGAFEDAVHRWPELVARVGTRDYASYARIVQGTLIDVAREQGRHPLLVHLDPEELPPLASAAGLEVTDWRTRAALAAKLADAGRAVAWPPGRNEECWCGNGRKYDKCCDTEPVDPARRPTPTDAHGKVRAYELDITLVGVRPRIWRRIAISADATFGDLHHAIQIACDGDTDRCGYENDLGDGWRHDVRVVRRIEEPADLRQQLLDGARAFPPEDCGGLFGSDQCVEVATGGDDPDDRRDWLGNWDPDHFDLARLKKRFDR